MAEKITVKISQLLNDLHEGLSRKEIAEKYNLPFNQVKTMFEHPKLKGKRTRTIRYELIDDTEETVQESNEPDVNQEEGLKETDTPYDNLELDIKSDTSDVIDPDTSSGNIIPSDDNFEMNNNPLIN